MIASLATAPPPLRACNVKFTSDAGMMRSVDSDQPVTSTEPSNPVAVKLWPAPSLRIAPAGMPEIDSVLKVPVIGSSAMVSPSIPDLAAPQMTLSTLFAISLSPFG